MAGYQGGADQTVIAAAKSAVAVPKGYHASVWDYKEFVEGVANVAKFVVGKVSAANERMSTIAGIEEGINKEFWSANNTDYFQGGKEEMAGWSKTMAMTLPFTKAHKEAKRNYDNKMISYQKIKEDEVKLEEIIKAVNSATGPEQSAFNNPMLKSLMAEIQGGTGMFDNSVRFTDDGIVVMGPNGEETLLADLPSITLKTDGKATHDLVNTQLTGAVDLKSKGNWNNRNKYLVRQNISGHLDTLKRNGLGSAAFDYEHYTANGYMSFADHLMETSGAFNDAFNEWKRTGGVGASEADIRETKMSLAQQLWDNDQSMKDEYLDFVMDNVLDFQVGEQRVIGTNKKKKKKKIEESDFAEDDLGSVEETDVEETDVEETTGTTNIDWIVDNIWDPGTPKGSNEFGTKYKNNENGKALVDYIRNLLQEDWGLGQEDFVTVNKGDNPDLSAGRYLSYNNFIFDSDGEYIKLYKKVESGKYELHEEWGGDSYGGSGYDKEDIMQVFKTLGIDSHLTKTRLRENYSVPTTDEGIDLDQL